MEGISTKVLLLVAALFLFVTLIVRDLQPAIGDKGTEVKNQITSTNVGG